MGKLKVLVTGGAGFIGSHIVDAYAQAGHRVVVIDNLSNGLRKNVNPKAKFYRADIRNLKMLEKIFKREQPDVVNHQAAIASVTTSMRGGADVLETNAMGTANILIASGVSGIKKLIFHSSCAVYGNTKKLPANEATALRPLSPYGLSKVLAEMLVQYYADFFGFNYLILRPSNVYGPRQRAGNEGGVVATLQKLMRSGVRPVVYGDGLKTRDYVYVGDIVRANLLGLTRGKNKILNLGTGRETKDAVLFQTVAHELGFTKPPRSVSDRPGDIRRSAVDARHAKKILEWSAEVQFENGVRKTLEGIGFSQ